MTADPKKAARAALYVARKTFADGGDAEPQSITSADTSIKQVPAVFKSPLFRKTPGQRNLDIGGGKYDLGRDYLAQHGVESHVYDPYNRDPEHNEAVLKRFSDKPADSVTATNVLNVIQHPHHRAGVIEMAHRHLDDNGHAYFGIYAGDRSGQGKQTSKGYQNNLPASAYMDEVQRVFPHVQRKGDVIVARKKSFSSGGEVYSNHAPRHTMQSPAVAELKHLLTMHRDELRSMKGRTQYAAIDGIMKRISHEHGIAPSKLHDDWMSVYHQTPDAWVAGDHGNVVDRALKMTNRGGYAFGGSPAALAPATGAPINFAPAAGAFTGLPLPGTLNLAPSKATLAAILASRPTTYTGSSKPLESKYIGPSIPAPTFNASSYNLPDNPLEEDQGGGYGGIRDYGGGGNGGGGGGGAGGIGGGGPSARGGRIHRADGGEIPQEILNRIVSPFSGNEEQVKRALEIAQGYKTPIGNAASGQTGAYYSIKHPMGASEVSTKIKDIPGVVLSPKKEMSWEDLYKEGKGGSFINLGGDRSNLGRLTHINNKKLAWPIDLHAGAKYMMEPNPGSVWANNVSHATGFRNAILRAAEKGPVYGIYAPMGPMSVDSSHNMFDAVMAQIPGSNISKENIQKFNDDIKEARHLPANDPDKERVKEIMGKWPGLENPKEASLFARSIGGVHRAAIIKHMDKASWHKLGFPAIGMTRAAITDPEVFNAPGNVIGHRVVKFNPENIVGKETAMPHSTYTHSTSGEYFGDIPLVQRHYAMPDVIEQIVRKVTKKGQAIHPYSIDPNGRSAFRKMTEENRQIQPINQRMLDSTQLGLKRQSDYGLKNGGSAKSLVDIALNLTKGKK